MRQTILLGLIIFSLRLVLAEEGETIIKIKIKGNQKVSSWDIKATLSSKEGKPYLKHRVRDDIRNLYALEVFKDIKVDLKETPEGVILTYIVEEREVIEDIQIKGNKELSTDDIKEVIDLKRGSILKATEVRKNQDKIEELYREKGFFLTEVGYKLKKVKDKKVEVVFEIEERHQVMVREITFVGNKSISDEELLKVMEVSKRGFFSGITRSGTYRHEIFQRDLARIAALYYDYGFINVKIDQPKIELSSDMRYLYITIYITEGKRFKIGKIGISGDLIGPRGKIRSLIKVKEGEYFSRRKIGLDIQRITRYYQDLGYAYVNITPQTEIHERERIVDLRFEIEKGYLVYFERINIRGNTKTSDRVIRRELLIYEGDRFSQSKLEKSKIRVMRLGFFEEVVFSTRRGSEDKWVEVNIEVKEKSTGTFQIGAGVSSAENILFHAQISQENLFGHGQSLALMASLSTLRQRFMLRFMEPYFLDTKWIFAFSLYSSVLSYINFIRESRGGSITWGYPFTSELAFYLTYTLEDINVRTSGRVTVLGGRVSGRWRELPLANLFNDGITSSIHAKLSYDSRDNRLFPTSGQFHTISGEFADSRIGSENIFTRYRAISRWFFPLGWGMVLKLKGSFGVVVSDSPQGVPIFERFFPGGIFTVRGFLPQSLGPRLFLPRSLDPNANPLPWGFNIGGNMQLIFNFELEYPIFKKAGIMGVIFLDAGNAFNLEENLCRASSGYGVTKFTDPCVVNPIYLRASCGFGFRWFSPLGPLRFEWGIPLFRFKGEEAILFEFTIGSFF